MVRRDCVTFVAYAARDFFIGVIFVYGFVYTSYKYGNPLFGRNDFFKYKEMIGYPFDFSATSAPFVLRQIPALVASIFYRLGIHYDTAAAIDTLGYDQDTKRRFFSLILSNGLAVCLSFAILSSYLRTKLSRNSIVDLFALFGILAAWFYFPSAVIAPVTGGWGWVASSLLAIAFLERKATFTYVACLIALFSRETTLIFGLMMFLSVILFEGDRCFNTVASALALTVSCLAYLTLRVLFTTGYEHQIVPWLVIANFHSFRPFPEFLFQWILSQGLLVLLLICIAMKQLRYAAYLLLAAAAMAVVALGTAVTDLGLLLGETLPFYAVMFLLTWHDERAVIPFRPE
jgi:hypothetical protein